MAGVEGTGTLKSAHVQYDFAVDAGAIGAITLRMAPGAPSSAAGAIPIGSVILGGYLRVLTGLTTGSSATMALSCEGANDLVSATVVSGAPYSTTGFKSIIPVFTGATMFVTTAARSLTATIAVGTVTAGKFDLVVFYR